ncbi:hypothetical protein KDW67_33960 [Burkholderia cenocepacia]|uniref:hypothetical protein n=1 Tax=Burkholderia cenocepacia TaxID=95486 RepID=UPI00097C3B05|nr:hypothetical protein [Burkholderia cenocepacia]AQQ46764.1 hypothetical protein A8F32_13270 [Burkholderia cenocepacia]MBR8264983.1 hypothetical protein [Burkholderia cenocepacia]ONI97097.1 hypothetical protein A8F33_33355 [Burkholderia cenocepacia]ONJ01621.1 hypothetical protein A8F53_16585 [Burkholderia cenocepacia]ONJ33949.1 hypothetical protein A8F38_07545 [Burkholderia cenocepacia]
MARIFGRVVDPATGHFKQDADGSFYWQTVETPDTGDASQFWLTALSQNLLLILGESPFNGNTGIPAFDAVETQVPPDLYVQFIQRKYAPYFLSLTIVRVPQPQTRADGSQAITYNVSVVTRSGQNININVTG